MIITYFTRRKTLSTWAVPLSQGYLWKQSGGTKTADGRAKQSLGSKRRKWSRRWFVLVEGARPLGWKESCFCRGWSDHADSDQIRAAS